MGKRRASAPTLIQGTLLHAVLGRGLYAQPVSTWAGLGASPPSTASGSSLSPAHLWGWGRKEEENLEQMQGVGGAGWGRAQG